MSMTMDYDDWRVKITDNQIVALSQCFADSNLQHELISDHCVTLGVQGAWLNYDVAFEYLLALESFRISAALPLDLQESQHGTAYGLIGRINTDLPLGHFQLDTRRNCITYRYNLPEIVLPTLDFEVIEALIETTVIALETLYPIAKSLLQGQASLEDALSKYLHPAEGTA
ncbi:MAG: YbjN domain-containing protein [Alphaproteobacteria bacterium]|nr:YbjN domain-containing protein [Alphaproteobacteria bacterium]